MLIVGEAFVVSKAFTLPFLLQRTQHLPAMFGRVSQFQVWAIWA